jgi:hypothetical protein
MVAFEPNSRELYVGKFEVEQCHSVSGTVFEECRSFVKGYDFLAAKTKWGSHRHLSV